MAHAHGGIPAGATRLVENPTASEVITLVYGAAFLVAGVAGFFVTGFDDFAGHTGETLLGLEVNPLHNIVHLVIGVAGIAAAFRVATAITYGLAVAAGYGIVFFYGLFAVGNDWDFLSLNWADNWFHLGAALVGLLIALIGKRELDRMRSGEGRYRTSDRPVT